MPLQGRIGWRSGVSNTPLLDVMASYTNAIGAAWGFRKLRSVYNGSCFTVRRSYDNTEMEIGFTSTGVVDELALSTFISEGVELAATDVSNWDGAVVANDTDATSFITAAGLTGTNQTAIRRLVAALKFEGLWTKMQAVYPFIGGNASSHKFNLKDARDTNDAYRLTFSGGWTHGASGAQPNGTNAYASTQYVMSVGMTANNGAMGVYIQNDTNYVSNGWDQVSSMTEIGCMGNPTWMGTYEQNGRSSIGVKINFTSAGTNARMMGGINSYVNSDGICVTDARGLTMFNRTNSSEIRMLKNDQLSVMPFSRISSTWNDGPFLPSIPVTLAAFSYRNANGSVTYTGLSNRIQSFAFISNGLTDIESLKLARIIQRYQTDLGRAITTNEFQFDPGVGYVKNLYDQGPDAAHFRMYTQHAQPVVARGGVLIKDSNKLSMELNGLFSGMVSENVSTTSTFSYSSYYFVGTKVGVGTWSGNNMGDDGHIVSLIPAANATDYQAGYFYLPTKLGSYVGARSLSNHNSFPTLKLYPTWVHGYGLSPSNFNITTGQHTILNWFSTDGGNLLRISKESTESTNSTSISYGAVSGKFSLGWYSTGNPYNHFSNFRLSEMVFVKSTYSNNYYSVTGDASIRYKAQFLKNQTDYYGIGSIPTVDDPDAQIFVTSTAATQSEATAINTFVKGLKTEGLWTKLVSIMPFIGSTKYRQAFNLKNPFWSNRIGFGSTTAHDANGFTSNGNVEGMANAGIGLNATFTWNNIHMAAYVSNMTSGGHSMGSSSGSPTYLAINPTYKAFALSSWSIVAGNGVGVNNSTSAGFYIGNSLSTTMKIYENGTAIVTGTASATNLNTTYNAHVGGSGDSRQSAKFKYASYGYGLTDAEASAYSALVNTFLTSLGKI